MDEKKAIDCLKNIIEYWSYKPTEVEAAKLAIKALEKQIPIKAVESTDNVTTKYSCPICGRLFWEKAHIMNYCDECGRRLGENLNK